LQAMPGIEAQQTTIRIGVQVSVSDLRNAQNRVILAFGGHYSIALIKTFELRW